MRFASPPRGRGRHRQRCLLAPLRGWRAPEPQLHAVGAAGGGRLVATHGRAVVARLVRGALDKDIKAPRRRRWRCGGTHRHPRRGRRWTAAAALVPCVASRRSLRRRCLSHLLDRHARRRGRCYTTTAGKWRWRRPPVPVPPSLLRVNCRKRSGKKNNRRGRVQQRRGKHTRLSLLPRALLHDPVGGGACQRGR